MVSFGKLYFALSFAHIAFQSCGLWKDCTFYFLIGDIILESELRDVSGFLLCLVFVFFVSMSCLLL